MSDELNAAVVRALRTVDIPEDAFPVTVKYSLPVEEARPGTGRRGTPHGMIEYEETEITIGVNTADVLRQVSWTVDESA